MTIGRDRPEVRGGGVAPGCGAFVALFAALLVLAVTVGAAAAIVTDGDGPRPPGNSSAKAGDLAVDLVRVDSLAVGIRSVIRGFEAPGFEGDDPPNLWLRLVVWNVGDGPVRLSEDEFALLTASGETLTPVPCPGCPETFGRISLDEGASRDVSVYFRLAGGQVAEALRLDSDAAELQVPLP